MKYVVIFAVAVGVAALVVPYVWSVKDSPMPPQLEREVQTGSDEPSLFPDLVALTAVRGRVTAVESDLPIDIEIVLPPPTPLQLFLSENPGSPLALLTPEEAAKYVPTRENLVAWVESVDELDDIDLSAVEWTDDLQHLWGLCQQEQALYVFAVQHHDRELRRWRNREQSVSLEAELHPVRQFMDRNLGNDSEVWRLASLFSDEVANKIRGEGENADDGDDEESQWDLLRALAQAGSPSFDAVVETLRRQQR